MIKEKAIHRLHRLDKRALLRRILFMFIAAIVVSVFYVELKHKYNFGHFVLYGLHVDALSEDAWIGIPGQKKMYWAELSNFSFRPVRLEGCDYITDAFDPGTSYTYLVQRWNSYSSEWQNIYKPEGEVTCHPVPTSTIESHFVSRRLWPGMSVELDRRAIGANDKFRKGDHARFVVFTRMNNWQNGVPSAAFTIEDDVQRGSSPSSP